MRAGIREDRPAGLLGFLLCSEDRGEADGKGKTTRMGWRGGLEVLMVPCKGEQDRTVS